MCAILSLYHISLNNIKYCDIAFPQEDMNTKHRRCLQRTFDVKMSVIAYIKFQCKQNLNITRPQKPYSDTRGQYIHHNIMTLPRVLPAVSIKFNKAISFQPDCGNKTCCTYALGALCNMHLGGPFTIWSFDLPSSSIKLRVSEYARDQKINGMLYGVIMVCPMQTLVAVIYCSSSYKLFGHSP